MTHLSGISALRRKFSLPVVLSVGLHGLAMAALGTFVLPPAVKPVPNPAMTVSLVAPKPAHVARPKPAPLQPVTRQAPARKARAVAVKRAAPRSVAPIEQVTVASEPQPNFKDLPRVPAPAAPPTVAHAETAVFALPESMEPLDSLSTGVGAVSLNRPLPVASSRGTRLLRDTAAETGSVRSKVRPGNNPRPEYPRAAREAGWEGTVMLQVLVLPDGTAGAVALHKTSGHSLLDEAALSAVKDWKFIPAMDGNFPVQSVVRLPVRFDLKAS